MIDWGAGQCYVIVGTPGLGYLHLLCLGKSLIVILNYALTAK